MKIKVTQDDINKGAKRSPLYCPVSSAFLRDTDLYAKVYPEFIWFPNEDYEDIWLPQEAAKFIEKFDSDQTVEPFEFEIELKKTS